MTNQKEEAILTFTKMDNSQCKLTASFYPVPKDLTTLASDTHEPALAIMTIFQYEPLLIIEIANYLDNGGDIKKPKQFLAPYQRRD